MTLEWVVQLVDENISSGHKVFIDEKKAEAYERKLREAAELLRLGSYYSSTPTVEEIEE